MKTHAMTRNEKSSRHAAWTLQVVLRALDGCVMAREPVSDGDLGDMRCQLWMHAHLRRGDVDLPLSAMSSAIVPEFGEGGANVIVAYRLETTRGGETRSVAFTPRSLECVALRVAERLVKHGVIANQSHVRWEVT